MYISIFVDIVYELLKNQDNQSLALALIVILLQLEQFFGNCRGIISTGGEFVEMSLVCKIRSGCFS
jgi:hypothetical protein